MAVSPAIEKIQSLSASSAPRAKRAVKTSCLLLLCVDTLRVDPLHNPPAYNQAHRLAPSLEKLGRFCSRHFEEYEIVVVDDGSTDGTWDLIQGYRGLPLRGVRLPQNRGKGAAVKAGMLEARGDYRFFTDSDLPYDLSAFASAMQLFRSEGCDLVAGARDMAGSRDSAGTSRARKAASKVFSALAGMLFGFDIRDSQCGFKGFTAKAAEALFGPCTTSGYAFDVEILARARKLGLKICRIPVTLVVNQDSSIRLPRDGFVMLCELAAIYFRMSRALIQDAGFRIQAKGEWDTDEHG